MAFINGNTTIEIERSKTIIRIKPIGFAWRNKFFGYVTVHSKEIETKREDEPNAREAE